MFLQGLEPPFVPAASGTAEQAAEVKITSAAPKGAIEKRQLAASLKRCPDTNRGFFPRPVKPRSAQTVYETSSE